ncbi:hypothetical protein N7492_007003 [Penicillium capsulatum]|uniref:Uncharacterized protein n=1 Tax=Penicillium capsulatum TaxID=69766 RepID=A0A9W9LLP3_9EURO|nr:hypothetical protein N7492_007003 [Penicillium capsulatum]KAJ6116836.1 hypothetical protein N7512_006561 [Penicillium capsulatum]
MTATRLGNVSPGEKRSDLDLAGLVSQWAENKRMGKTWVFTRTYRAGLFRQGGNGKVGPDPAGLKYPPISSTWPSKQAQEK